MTQLAFIITVPDTTTPPEFTCHGTTLDSSSIELEIRDVRAAQHVVKVRLSPGRGLA